MSEAQLLLLRQKHRERELEEQSRREELGIQPESATAGEMQQQEQQDHREVMNIDEEGVDDHDDENSPHHYNPEVNIPSGMVPKNTTLSNNFKNIAATDNLSNGLNEDTTNDDQMPSGKKQSRKSKHGMYQDIEEMMFGFGDNWPPASDSVELIEDLSVKYIKDLCQRALEVANYTGKLDKQCFMYAVRKDTRKFSRAYTLLKANEELKSARTSTIAEEEKHTEVLKTASTTQHDADDIDIADAEGASSGVHVGHDNAVGQGKGGGRGIGGRGKGSSGKNKNSGEPGDISAEGAGAGGRGRGRGGGSRKSSDGPGGGRGRGRGGRGRGKGSDTGTEDAINAAVEPAAAALTIEPEEEN